MFPWAARRYEQLTVAAGDDPLGAILAALPPDTQEHIYRIILTGPADLPDCKALYQSLQSRFFSLTIRDRTTPRRSLWESAGDDTLKGLFLQQLQAAMQADSALEPTAKLAAADHAGADGAEGGAGALKLLRMTACFGTLQHQELILQEGLNLLSYPNESGKTTWAAFLLAMLYGVDSSERASRSPTFRPSSAINPGRVFP